MHIGDQLSLANDTKTIANSLNIREDMGIKKYSFLIFFEIDHEILDHLATDRIESAHRLIEEYDIWIMEYGLGESDTLEHSF